MFTTDTTCFIQIQLPGHVSECNHAFSTPSTHFHHTKTISNGFQSILTHSTRFRALLPIFDVFKPLRRVFDYQDLISSVFTCLPPVSEQKRPFQQFSTVFLIFYIPSTRFWPFLLAFNLTARFQLPGRVFHHFGL